MSERHEDETLEEYRARLKQSKALTKARLRGLLAHDSRNHGTLVKHKADK